MSDFASNSYEIALFSYSSDKVRYNVNQWEEFSADMSFKSLTITLVSQFNKEENGRDLDQI